MRLIDADAVMETIKRHHYILSEYRNSTDYGMFTVGIQQAVDEQPTIDPVRAAGACYCRECKYFDPDENIAPNTGSCSFVEMVRLFDDFCSQGEPKEETQ